MDSKKILFENMGKLNPDFQTNENLTDFLYTTGQRNDTIENQFDDQYQTKVEKLKQIIDKLFDEKDYDVIDTLYRLLIGKTSAPAPASFSLKENYLRSCPTKIKLIKGKIGFIFENRDITTINKVYDIINNANEV